MISDGVNQDTCPICRGALGDAADVVEVRQKGADGINSASVQRGDDIVVSAGEKVHSKCRKRYINPKDIKSQQEKKCEPAKRSARSSSGPFNSQTDCLFCGTTVTRESADFSYVKTDSFVKTILECCDNRSDEWGLTVKGRIEYYGCDLHAADCLYHHSCSGNFRSGLGIPLQFQNIPDAKRRKPGRPKSEDQEQAFMKICTYLEQNDEEQLTISHLRDKMKEFLMNTDSEPFGNQYLKGKLKEQYGNSIHFAEGEGLHDIVTMREKTSEILRSYFNTQAKDEASQKQAIIETAARFIKSDIKSNVTSLADQYPSATSLKLDSALSFVPDSLRTLLNCLFVGKETGRKVAAIGQAVVQAVRPRAVLAPLQLGLAVQTHHLYRSEFLLDTLHEMGFSSSYKEVLRFEKNAADLVAPDMLVEDIDLLDMGLLFAGDNVDHNILTIDGKGTFHGMGIVAAITPGRKKDRAVPRRNISNLEFAVQSKIPITEHRFAKHVRQTIVFEQTPALVNCDMTIDVLWELSLNFKEETPGWQGMMHIIHQGLDHPGQSSVVFLPMIDLYSGDKTCILSTLDFVCNLAAKHHAPPIITFDQPLYWKAAEIITDAPKGSHLKNTVLMLGTFHTFMNLLGAIGTLMEGTGLTDIMEVVYGENAVHHMMTGKSVQRAFRGHLLVDRCLNQMVVSDLLEDNPQFESLVDQAREIYASLVAKEMTLESAVASDTLIQTKEKIDTKKTELTNRSKTSQLWINYQRMLQTARALIKADRTGSWMMHLRAVLDCLPIFAAAGHYNYLKSAYFYVQEMSQLETRHPDVHDKFSRGFHVVRRSNQFWAGLSCDLVIEQTLMRSLKSSGGLTHGSGMTEEMRALWTMSTPITSEYNNAMQEFNNLTYTTSEQHRESTEARVKRDHADLDKIKETLFTCTPFSPDSSLRNIVTGVVAKEVVNVHEFETVGTAIVEQMVGKPVFGISFKRKDRAKTLADQSTIKVAKDRVIQPALLFQRFLVVSKSGDLSLEDVMSYELSPFPPSLFEAKEIFRKADKPQLAHAVAEFSSKESDKTVMDTIPSTEHYVLDGGSLVHRVPWKRGDSYGAIAQSYADFTTRLYGKATVVFDGYSEGPSIKDNTHQRRGQNTHPAVSFNANTKFVGKKDDFLSRPCNKQGLIHLITEELHKKGCTVINAPGDADVDIAKAAIEASQHHSTTLIGEDTDLLILLLYYTETNNNKGLFFRSDKSSAPKVYDICEMKQVLGSDLCSHLLFVHAFTGCDTTSRIFSVSKKSVFQKLVNGESTMKTCSDAFLLPDQTNSVIEDLGSKAMAVMFGGKSIDSLASLRYNLFSKKIVSAKSFVAPERLPPTESSTKYHCFRVYYQIMVWTGNESGMDAVNWGWKLEDNQFVPVMTNKPAAPETLLRMVHCNCTTACRTPRCSCRGYGLPCTSACGSCQVDNCDNPHNQSLPEEEFDNDNL